MGYSIADMPTMTARTGSRAAASAAPAAAVEPGGGATGGGPAVVVSGAALPDDVARRAAPLRLSAMSPLVARATRLFCDARCVALIERVTGVVAWQASVRELLANAARRFDDAGVLDLTHPAGRVHVRFELGAHPALEIAAWPPRGGAQPHREPDLALRTAVAGVLLEPVLQALAALGLANLHLARLSRETQPPGNSGDAVLLEVSFMHGERRHCAEFSIGLAWLTVLETILARQHLDFAALLQARLAAAGPPTLTPLAGCRVPGRIVLGARRLPVRTLRQLAHGDVLIRSLPDSLAALIAGDATTAPDLTVAWGTPGLVRLHARASVAPNSLTLTEETTMTDELDAARVDDSLAVNQPDDPIEIGDLDLPVQFEVDTVALSLAQLYALRPGYVLELPTPIADAQLKLVAHGQTIGYGELVTVGEHLGIRILRMAHGDGSVQ
jgi:type III secretion protein Q